jgi:DNA-binding transcriptional ArsR family regulator
MIELEQTHQIAEAQAELCKIFSHPSRILILWALNDSDLSVGEIAEYVGASIQNTSHHLRIMKGIGILHAHREGQLIYYGIADEDRCRNLLRMAPTSKQSQNRAFGP